MNDLKLKLHSRMPVILDGATATELQRRGMPMRAPLWSTAALLTPQGQAALIELHKSYIDAGADVITTNTFRTNRTAVAESGIDIQPSVLVHTAVSLVRTAISESGISGKRIYVAGSVAPVGDAYKPDQVPNSETLISNHRESIANLRDAGVDFILAETMNNWREISIVGHLCKEASIPFMISMVCNEHGLLLSGENYRHLKEFVQEFQPLAVCVNCSDLGNVIQALTRLSKITDAPLGVYPNIEDRSCLHAHENASGYIKPKISTQQFSEFMAESTAKFDLSVIGGCCGTTAKYIRTLRDLVASGIL